MWDMITPLCVPITSQTTAASVIASAELSSTSIPCYSFPFGIVNKSYKEAKAKCATFIEGHLWTPTNPHQKQLPSGFVKQWMWTSASMNLTGEFVWENQQKVTALPYSVRYDLFDGRTLPTDFVRGSNERIGSLVWGNSGQPNMEEGNDVVDAYTNPPYGVFLYITSSPSNVRRVVCEHRCY